MPSPILTTIATGFDDAVGSAYRVTKDQLLIADAGARTIVAVTAHAHVKTTVGTGYGGPSDIALSSDGLHAYITDSPGSLLRVPLSQPQPLRGGRCRLRTERC